MASGEQNITALPVKTNTGVANSDYFMGIDSAEGYQILIRDVAKYIMENYNGSTLAGSAQTPKAAIDALNSKNILNLGTSIPANSDLNNYTTFGNYFSSSASGLTNSPTSVTNTALQLWVIPRANAERAFQVAFVYVPSNLPELYIRSMTGATSWSNWKQL